MSHPYRHGDDLLLGAECILPPTEMRTTPIDETLPRDLTITMNGFMTRAPSSTDSYASWVWRGMSDETGCMDKTAEHIGVIGLSPLVIYDESTEKKRSYNGKHIHVCIAMLSR